jgi:hypothetical protein
MLSKITESKEVELPERYLVCIAILVRQGSPSRVVKENDTMLDQFTPVTLAINLVETTSTISLQVAKGKTSSRFPYLITDC